MDFPDVILFADSLFTSWTFWSALARAVLGLGFVIFVHELGHFLVAKACGVKCEKFYVGFDVPIKIGPLQLPRALWRRQWGETEYGIGIVPLGGYVKMLGQDDNPANQAKEAERTRVAGDASSGVATAGGETLDPRSYPAKPVWQRLLIISAGVTTNLVFAVIFAMLAYRIGVSYTPCVVGYTSPGLSAWEVGLMPGDRVLQLGRDGKRSEHLRFDKDMVVSVFVAGPNAEMDLLVAPRAEPSETRWVPVRLSSPMTNAQDRPLIGMGPLMTNRVGLTWTEWSKDPPPEDALAKGDRVVAVNGVATPDGLTLQSELARQLDKPLELTVQNDESTDSSRGQRHVTWPRRPLRGPGFAVSMGPIRSIRAHSPAARAGLQPGDRLVAINGQPIRDPMTVPQKLTLAAGEQVELTVERDGSGEDRNQPDELTISLTPDPPQEYQRDYGGTYLIGSYAAGFAFAVTNRIEQVLPESPAAKAGLVTGDRVLSAEFLPAEGREAKWKELAQQFGKEVQYTLSETGSHWAEVWGSLQDDFPDTRLKLTVDHKGEEKTVTLSTIEDADNFLADRGLIFHSLEEVHYAGSWSEAFWLGLRETKEGVEQVLATLEMLINRRLSITKVGGPVTIVRVAGAEASQSNARLLVFLTMLSANLAVLNFLPIPVLDGGHVMFLLYEGIFRKPVDERVAFGLTLLGFSLLMGLMVLVVGMDVFRIFNPA